MELAFFSADQKLIAVQYPAFVSTSVTIYEPSLYEFCRNGYLIDISISAPTISIWSHLYVQKTILSEVSNDFYDVTSHQLYVTLIYVLATFNLY